MVLRKTSDSDRFQMLQAKHFVSESKKLSFIGDMVASLQSSLHFYRVLILPSPLQTGIESLESEWRRLGWGL